MRRPGNLARKARENGAATGRCIGGRPFRNQAMDAIAFKDRTGQ